MPTGRPDFWYGNILQFEDIPDIAHHQSGPSSWAHCMHVNNASAHHTKTTSADIDHGLVQGLADDDHTQYLKANGSRNVSGSLTFNAITCALSWKDGATSLNYVGCEGDGAHFFYIYRIGSTQYLLTLSNTGVLTVVSDVHGADSYFNDGDFSGNLVVDGTINGATFPSTHFTPRANVTVYDYTTDDATLIMDNTWRVLTLSSWATAEAKAVLLRVSLTVDIASAAVYFKRNGDNDNTYPAATALSNQTTYIESYDLIVPCDTDRKIKYKGNSHVNHCYVTGAGFWS